ncbi:MAG: hypothetical protein ACFCGT_01025 [Sandaracinaceae bacterium]
MAIRDLGYRAYEGERRTGPGNVWRVVVRHGLSRIASSWIVRIWTLFSVVGALFFAGAILLVVNLGSMQSGLSPEEVLAEVQPAGLLGLYLFVHLFFIGSVITLTSGAGVLAEDFAQRSFPFYFAKPVTPVQYLLGRIGALAIYLFLVEYVPVLLPIGVIASFGGELWLEYAGLALPMLLACAITALSLASLSVGVSALSRSRALTRSAWALIFFVPYVLTALVALLANSQWPMLASIPGLLALLGNELLRVETGDLPVHWYHAAPILALLVAGTVALTARRLRSAEVIT